MSHEIYSLSMQNAEEPGICGAHGWPDNECPYCKIDQMDKDLCECEDECGDMQDFIYKIKQLCIEFEDNPVTGFEKIKTLINEEYFVL